MALYKNWPAICDIGRANPMLMMVLGNALLNEDDEITQGLFVGFPDCFSTTEVKGPFPLSLIRSVGGEMARKNGFDDGEKFPSTIGALDELSVPYVTFNHDPEEADEQWPLLPPGIDPKAVQGQICEWNGQKMVVLENGDRTMDLAPVEAIALDL